MELCEGGDLIHNLLLKNEKVMKEKDAAIYMEKLVKALIHIHKLNIIHRDIKPDNIMIGQDNEIKFIDFGFAIIEHKKRD